MNIISLGAGVQSSTMALMAAHGEITPMPDCAIFADTQSEPAEVYRHLDWLEPQLPFPVHRVTKGNLMADQIAWSQAKDGTKYIRNLIPAFTKNPDGSIGMLLRKCTGDYKLAPIRRKVRELANGNHVIQWIGISLDEAHRMKPSGVKYITNHYPLVDQRLTRGHCLEWMGNKGYPKPPKSACMCCPYHNNEQWGLLSESELSATAEFEREWNKVAQEDQRKTQVRGIIRLHRSCDPIDKVDFRTSKDAGQVDMFGEECEGMCGV